MHSWQWHTWEGLPYLTCSILESWPHGFFTQQCWPRLPQALTLALHPQAIVYRLKQVHGNTVLTPPEVDDDLTINSSNLAQADGLISTEPSQAVWVASADCTPVLIGDVKTGHVAALHAGWRGTAAQIVPVAVQRMQSQGSKIESLRVALGPAIAGEVYQVTEEVAIEVCRSIISQNTTNNIVDSLHSLPDSPLFADPEPGKVRLDVRRVNTLQLQGLGFSLEQIAIAPYCTYQHSEHFFSYRRLQEKKVQWSGIVSCRL
ncbi:peptidoglycan editing factor PgeF [Anabaena sp. FACHB-1237]|uniref:peptidoglycan editing factor PgeF n=1 Tax=Anabaena sp. FACHB-1237 TaxID=2692769 RepID=UPI00168179C2|nr:peptidoglycan editing factor PgeF [Anabaena sp. FACHB-1237]MBD2136535.1 peptidoglycan editing factor PgeF [Anabaena sp. FACHB-1237]